MLQVTPQDTAIPGQYHVKKTDIRFAFPLRQTNQLLTRTVREVYSYELAICVPDDIWGSDAQLLRRLHTMMCFPSCCGYKPPSVT